MTVTETRRKLFAWSAFISALATDFLVAPILRVKYIYMLLPALQSKGILPRAAEMGTTLRATCELILRRQGVLGLWRGSIFEVLSGVIRTTKTVEKIIERPAGAIHSVFASEDPKLPAWRRKVFPIIGYSLQLALKSLVDHPLQIFICRFACDLSKTNSVVQSAQNAAGLGCGWSGLRVLYTGLGVRLALILPSVILLSVDSIIGSNQQTLVGSISQGVAALVSTFSTAITLRMAVLGTKQADVQALVTEALRVEGPLWWLRGVSLVIAEQVGHLVLSSLRTGLMMSLFRDVIHEQENRRQQHINEVVAKLRAQYEGAANDGRLRVETH